MAYVPKDKKIVNDTTPMMCTIEGIAKKDHVVRRKLAYSVACANVHVNMLRTVANYVSRSVMSQDYIMKVQRGINHDDSWQVSPTAYKCINFHYSYRTIHFALNKLIAPGPVYM